ncbi:hypothetical protein E3N88_09458 [Mikania micrantha]|uniref:Uncharacterized protein n=1 Tax=Mikania micrantha TaxID=192012 RepID=A0A5N6PJT2_9ASTR|nr:hypothetical protein E3N88_09458 [Mikania micrantha]
MIHRRLEEGRGRCGLRGNVNGSLLILSPEQSTVTLRKLFSLALLWWSSMWVATGGLFFMVDLGAFVSIQIVYAKVSPLQDNRWDVIFKEQKTWDWVQEVNNEKTTSTWTHVSLNSDVTGTVNEMSDGQEEEGPGTPTSSFSNNIPQGPNLHAGVESQSSSSHAQQSSPSDQEVVAPFDTTPTQSFRSLNEIYQGTLPMTEEQVQELGVNTKGENVD